VVFESRNVIVSMFRQVREGIAFIKAVRR